MPTQLILFTVAYSENERDTGRHTTSRRLRSCFVAIALLVSGLSCADRGGSAGGPHTSGAGDGSATADDSGQGGVTPSDGGGGPTTASDGVDGPTIASDGGDGPTIPSDGGDAPVTAGDSVDAAVTGGDGGDASGTPGDGGDASDGAVPTGMTYADYANRALTRMITTNYTNGRWRAWPGGPHD